MSSFLSPKLQSLNAYVPGEQPRDKKYIKLNTNESPYPPAPAVLSALSGTALENLRLYPDPTCRALKEKLAAEYEVNPENVFVCNGSDEALFFVFSAFCNGGVIFPEISYGFYKVFADLCGVPYSQIPLKDDFKLDISDYLGKNKTVVISNPNAPTGTCLSLAQIEEIVCTNPGNVVLIDEAYIDFGGQSCAALTKKYKNLMSVQTFSKSRSLAGGRLGFAIADKELIADLELIKYSTNPYNIDRLTQLIGIAVLSDRAYFDSCREKIILTREKTKSALVERGFTVTNSKANFLFCRSDKISGQKLYEKLRERGILVRHFSNTLTCDWVRISIGAEADMDALILAIDLILKG